MASRHINRPNATIAPRWPRSTHPCQPRDAWRTNSTQWWSGLNSPAIRAHRGNPSSGKYVPATSTTGVTIVLVTYEKWLIDLSTADPSTPNAAQPKPVTKPISGTVSIPQLGSRPNIIATTNGTDP